MDERCFSKMSTDMRLYNLEMCPDLDCAWCGHGIGLDLAQDAKLPENDYNTIIVSTYDRILFCVVPSRSDSNLSDTASRERERTVSVSVS